MSGWPVLIDGIETDFSRFEHVNKVAIGVSGGMDSVALMHLVRIWKSSFENRSPEIFILTVDHGLRKESEGETVWVKDCSSKLDFQHQSLVWNEAKPATKIQEAARQARYRLMTSYCRENDIPVLLTAHHEGDQAETFLMRLQRGSGLDGLSSIPERTIFSGVEIFRPLLPFSKQGLKTFLESIGAKWIEDASNQDVSFERVRVRRALAVLEELGIEQGAISLSVKRLARARTALDSAAGRFLRDFVILNEAGYCEISLSRLEELEDEICLRVLSRVLETVGGRRRPVQLAKLEKLFDAIKGDGEKIFTLSGCRIELSAGTAGFYRELRGTGIEEMELAPGQDAIWDRRFHVAVSADFESQVTVKALGLSGYDMIKDLLDHKIILPESARFSLVSFWRGEKILCVPHLGFYEQEATGKSGGDKKRFTVQFINRQFTPYGGDQFTVVD